VQSGVHDVTGLVIRRLPGQVDPRDHDTV
jgi:hypothetical protein